MVAKVDEVKSTIKFQMKKVGRGGKVSGHGGKPEGAIAVWVPGPWASFTWPSIRAGAVSGRCCRPREDDRRRAGLQHPPGCQFLGVLAQEELAERAGSVHQEHHGQAPASVLARMLQ